MINNRNGLDYVSKLGLPDHNLFATNEICIGCTADGDVVTVVEEVLDQMRMVEETDLYRFVKSGTEKQYPVQYSVHTEKALSFLHLEGRIY